MDVLKNIGIPNTHLLPHKSFTMKQQMRRKTIFKFLFSILVIVQCFFLCHTNVTSYVVMNLYGEFIYYMQTFLNMQEIKKCADHINQSSNKFFNLLIRNLHHE